MEFLEEDFPLALGDSMWLLGSQPLIFRGVREEVWAWKEIVQFSKTEDGMIPTKQVKISTTQKCWEHDMIFLIISGG